MALELLECRRIIHSAVHWTHDDRYTHAENHRRFLWRNRYGLMDHRDLVSANQTPDHLALSALGHQAHDESDREVAKLPGQMLAKPPEKAMRYRICHIKHSFVIFGKQRT